VVLQWLNERRYHGTDWVPHDARVREWSSGRTRLETLRAMGRKPRLVPNHTVADGKLLALQSRLRTLMQYVAVAVSIVCGPTARSGTKICARLSAHRSTIGPRTPPDAFRHLAMAWRYPDQTTKTGRENERRQRTLRGLLQWWRPDGSSSNCLRLRRKDW
jgi:hypothetical protein